MGRVDQALDRGVAADTLGFAASSAEAQSLMQLSHEFWVVGPAFASQPRRMRFSPAVTTHLSAGHDNVPPPPTPQRLRALLGRLNRIAAESKPEAAQGKSSGFRNQVFTPDMEALRQAESRGFERGRKEGEAAGRAAGSALYAVEIARVAEALKRLEGFAQGVEHAPMEASEAPHIPATPLPKRRAAVNGAPAPAGHVPTAGAMQLLSTAVTHWPVRFTWSQLAALNGRKARGGHFNSCRKFLADSGFVTEQDGKIEPADAAFGSSPMRTTSAGNSALGVQVFERAKGSPNPREPLVPHHSPGARGYPNSAMSPSPSFLATWPPYWPIALAASSR
jgi:hypothetical protein